MSGTPRGGLELAAVMPSLVLLVAVLAFHGEPSSHVQRIAGTRGASAVHAPFGTTTMPVSPFAPAAPVQLSVPLQHGASTSSVNRAVPQLNIQVHPRALSTPPATLTPAPAKTPEYNPLILRHEA